MLIEYRLCPTTYVSNGLTVPPMCEPVHPGWDTWHLLSASQSCSFLSFIMFWWKDKGWTNTAWWTYDVVQICHRIRIYPLINKQLISNSKIFRGDNIGEIIGFTAMSWAIAYTPQLLIYDSRSERPGTVQCRVSVAFISHSYPMMAFQVHSKHCQQHPLPVVYHILAEHHWAI